MKQLISFGGTVFAFACLGVFAGRVLPIPHLPTTTMFVAHAQSPPWGGNWCGIQVSGETANRYVYGSVNVECNPCWAHSGPYGNWGVDSFYGNRVDSDQYKGWSYFNPNCNESMDDPEWNSCTSTFTSSLYYNYPPGSPTQQFSGDTTSLGYVWDWYNTTEENGCSVLDESWLAGGTVLEIYELDPSFGDDHVTNLTVFSGTTVLDCSTDSCTPTASPFENNANGTTSAEFRVRLLNSCHWIDGKGCA
jgi:hypothetical protein